MVDLPPPEPKKLPEPVQPAAAQEALEPEAIQEAPELEEAVETEEADQADEPQEADEPEEAPEACGLLAPVDADEPSEPEPKRRVAFRAVEIAAQIHQVQEWLSLGKRPNQIRKLCSEEWGLSTRVAEYRIADARKQMVVDANVMDRQEKVGQMLQQLEQVLEQALRLNQGSNAIGALRLQADLLQLLSRQN